MSNGSGPIDSLVQELRQHSSQLHKIKHLIAASSRFTIVVFIDTG